MHVKKQQRYLADCPIDDDDADHDDETPGTIRASHLPDTSHIAPDEYAARRDAVRAIRSMVPDSDMELYDLWLAVRENGQRGEPGTLHRLRDYAHRQGIALEHRLLPHEAPGRRHPAASVVRRDHRPLPAATPGSVARGSKATRWAGGRARTATPHRQPPTVGAVPKTLGTRAVPRPLRQRVHPLDSRPAARLLRSRAHPARDGKSEFRLASLATCTRFARQHPRPSRIAHAATGSRC